MNEAKEIHRFEPIDNGRWTIDKEVLSAGDGPEGGGGLLRSPSLALPLRGRG